jgi:hypothetical protein
MLKIDSLAQNCADRNSDSNCRATATSAFLLLHFLHRRVSIQEERLKLGSGNVLGLQIWNRAVAVPQTDC